MSKVDINSVRKAQRTTYKSIVDVVGVLRKCGSPGRKMGCYNRAQPQATQIHGPSFSTQLATCPLDREPKRNGYDVYRADHVQWYLWQYVSKCIGSAKLTSNSEFLTDDFKRCMMLLRGAAEDAGADAHALQENDLQTFVRDLVMVGIGESIDVSPLTDDFATVIQAAHSVDILDTLFVYGVVFAGGLKKIIGPVLSTRFGIWLQRLLGMVRPDTEKDYNELAREHIKLIGRYENRKRGLDYDDIGTDPHGYFIVATHKQSRHEKLEVSDRKIIAKIFHSVSNHIALKHTSGSLLNAQRVAELFNPDIDLPDLFGTLPNR